ncbi:hypothetical protein Ae168Ps1_3754c [Pseudonocardia sp. Ae168_Ps1]|nr:hypothetical protein Ae168Ps1_3754c [Pseudonocardia sp. Ae168_Ps1]
MRSAGPVARRASEHGDPLQQHQPAGRRLGAAEPRPRTSGRKISSTIDQDLVRHGRNTAQGVPATQHRQGERRHPRMHGLRRSFAACHRLVHDRDPGCVRRGPSGPLAQQLQQGRLVGSRGQEITQDLPTGRGPGR